MIVLDWIDRRNCEGADPNLFFPERGDDRAITQAKAVCAGCEVQIDCLEYALRIGEKAGVWGGTSGNDRRRLRAQRRRLGVRSA